MTTVDNGNKTLAQVHKHHYVAFVVEGFAAAFANMVEAYAYASSVGAGDEAVQAVYRY